MVKFPGFGGRKGKQPSIKKAKATNPNKTTPKSAYPKPKSTS